MDKKIIIENFLSNRPNVVGAFGYGSGVIKQNSYTKDDKPQIDLILVTDDIKEWHTNNILQNPNDYSLKGRVRLSKVSRLKMKGPNNIVYCSQVQDGSNLFKYGLIETEDFINDLNTWDTFYVAGRFQKPMLEVKSNKELNEVILRNRVAAFLIACILSDEYTTYFDLFEKICNFSYMGDFRMGIAENPNKVKNIVNGSYDELYKIYSKYPFVKPVYGERIRINYDEITKYMNLLPADLLDFIAVSDNKELSNEKRILLIRKTILNYFIKKNRVESVTQAIDGYKNNGLAKSIPYVASKLSKKRRAK